MSLSPSSASREWEWGNINMTLFKLTLIFDIKLTLKFIRKYEPKIEAIVKMGKVMLRER